MGQLDYPIMFIPRAQIRGRRSSSAFQEDVSVTRKCRHNDGSERGVSRMSSVEENRASGVNGGNYPNYSHNGNTATNEGETSFGLHSKELRHACEEMAFSAIVMSGGGGSQINDPRSELRRLSSNEWDSGRRSSKCTCDSKRENKETVIINVGGQVFETYKSTLKRLRSCKLSDDNELMKYYREEKGDYFFDRDPFAFNIVMNYLRYGELHLPTYICGPALQREFKYWGIEEMAIERCCFQPYNTWKTQTKSLEKLEYDRKQSTTQTDLARDKVSKHCWKRCRARGWIFLQDPSSSTGAKVYAWISILFVFASIFSFCAETHPFFKIPSSEINHFEALYRLFTLEEGTRMTSLPQSSKRQNSEPLNMSLSSVDGTNTTAENRTQNFSSAQNATLSDEEVHLVQHPVLLIIDLTCVFYFSLEFLTRAIYSPKKLKFITSLQNIIDFVAILPDYVELILLAISPEEREGLLFMDFIFILRMLRLCRIFRLIRHVPGLWILLYTLKASFNELLLMFVFLLIGMVVFASLMHFAEETGKFENIPVGFWWAVVTMTTVGYGDMFPKTATGYVIGSICAISGLLMIAFTVPIIVSNFVLYYTHVQYGIVERSVTDPVKDIQSDVEIEVCSVHTNISDNDRHPSSDRSSKSLDRSVSHDSSQSNNLSMETNGHCGKL